MYKAKNNDSFISIVLKKILQVDILNYVCWLNAFLLELGRAWFFRPCSVLKEFDCPVKGLQIALDLILKYFEPY